MHGTYVPKVSTNYLNYKGESVPMCIWASRSETAYRYSNGRVVVEKHKPRTSNAAWS